MAGLKIWGIANPVEVRRLPQRIAGRPGSVYRNGITAVDKITDFVDASVTGADQATGGSLVANTLHYFTAIPGNRWGPCKVNANIDSLTTANDASNTHAVRMTIAQATGAEWYDIFLSVDAAPKWVGRITEAQRAAGDYEITAVGTVASGSGTAAGIIDVNVVGTGIQTSNAVFAQNNAYRPDTTPDIGCQGYSVALIKVKLVLDDLRSAPTLRLVPFFGNQQAAGELEAGSIATVSLLGALGQPLSAELELDVRGTPYLTILVDTISGQGAAVSIWVNLYR